MATYHKHVQGGPPKKDTETVKIRFGINSIKKIPGSILLDLIDLDLCVFNDVTSYI